MGWKGNLRTGIALARRLERSEKRRANNAARQYKEMLKQEAFENGQKVVQEYNDYIELISSTHKETSEFIDWNEVLKEKEPIKPVLLDTKEKEATFNLANYKPSFLDKIFGQTQKKLRKLEVLVVSARATDQEIFRKELQKYNSDYTEWLKYQTLAKGVLASDTESYKNVIEYLDPFSDLKELGSGLNIKFEKNYVVATLLGNGATVIPDFILNQTATGKVSKKKMPISKFNELYQDYICSCALRVAREIFSFLPIDYVFISVKSEMINSVNGHLEQQPILAVAIPRQTLDKLNFDSIDPSDSMRNFVHNMKFSKTTGFAVVSEIQPRDIQM